MITIINKYVYVKAHSNMAVWEAFPSENWIFGFDFAISMSSTAVTSLTQVGSFREEVEVESVKTGGAL